MKQEELEALLKSIDPNACWVNSDEYGFSRLITFDVLGETYFVEWYHNLCTLIRINLRIPFDKISDIYTWPTTFGKQLQFYRNNEVVAVLGTKRRKE